jgi:hypothetical protein
MLAGSGRPGRLWPALNPVPKACILLKYWFRLSYADIRETMVL